MKGIQRITALLLCFLMLFPTQGMTALAEVENIVPTEVQIEETLPLETEERIEETLPLEPVESGSEAEETGHIRETLPLEPLEETNGLKGITAVYWNPGGSLPAELLATESNAETATPSELEKEAAASGNDRADGFSPQHPVKSLEAALKQVDRLAEEEGVERADIVIYAMNPMEIPDGRMYVLNAGNVRIASWPGRSYKNDTVFYVNGGQLTLINAVLEPGDEGNDTKEAEMIRVRGGALQLGQNVRIDGRIVMDYTRSREMTEWEKASASNTATSSNAGILEKASDANWTEAGSADGSFDIGSYIFDTDEGAWELLEDKTQASTWREPIIELIDGFDGVDDGFLLELRSDNDKNNVTLARTLYADEVSEEEFAKFFHLVNEDAEEWSLIPVSEKTAVVRDTGAEEQKRFYQGAAPMSLDEEEEDGTEGTGAASMTVKRLSAARANSTTVIYWNPGPPFTYNGQEYPAGSDVGVDGTTVFSPVKTLKTAIEKAHGGTIIAMQTLRLDDASAGAYLEKDGNGFWLVKGASENVIPALRVWEVTAQPIFRVPAGEKLMLQDIELVGMLKNGQMAESPAIVVEAGGDLTICSNVTAETGYLQVNAFPELKDHPVHADSTDGVSATLFFSGINTNLEYRYTDVVVPTENLLPSGADSALKTEVGLKLMDTYRLAKANRLESLGGSSQFDWVLRPDTTEDDLVENPENLELYADYYYDAIYLDGLRGSDNAYGASCQYPVKTWAKAKEIWEAQMKRSQEARLATYAVKPGITKEEMDKLYPYPNTIYICGTVTVADTHLWELGAYTDYDGTTVRTEVVSHRDISKKDDGSGTLVHELPATLVEVIQGGELTVKDVSFRNNTDLADSRTIRVSGAGSRLVLQGDTGMSGKLDEAFQQKPKAVTRGSHVEVTDGGAVELGNDMTGFIEARQQGITASGNGTTVTMNGGTIRNHDVYDDTVAQTDQKRGAGVALTDGAAMTMNGGVISENKTYQYGGGVYVSGTGSSFTMNKGLIESNTISLAGTGFSQVAYGVGIYGGEGTTVTIGTANGSVTDVKVSGNSAYLVNGGGIYANGVLTIHKAEISDNRADTSLGGSYTSYQSTYKGRGVGIYVDTKGIIQMDGATVSENKVESPSKRYEHGEGAGIYCSSSQKNEIKNSLIFGNVIGRAVGTSYSYGGGIYAWLGSGGTLDIENTVISENRAYKGAGIHKSGAGGMNIRNCTIEKNVASDSMTATSTPTANGYGGGILVNSTGDVTMTDCRVRENAYSSGASGGAISLEYGNLWLLGTAADQAEVTANAGAGILIGSSASAVLYGENVLISGNSGSGLYQLGGSTFFRTSKFMKNAGTEGGGINLRTGGTCRLEDVRIEENEVTKTGGGVYLDGGSLYFSERTPGTSSLTRNHARENGGGISQMQGAIYLNISGDMINTAGVQGNNIYQGTDARYQPTAYLLQGNLRQPDNTADGKYNVYLNTGKTGGIYIDPTKVTIEKRAGTAPEAVYLNTASLQIYYLKAPDTAETAVMPIDVNTDVFQVGSVLVRPANKTVVTMERPNAGLDGAEKENFSYSALKDATAGISYVSGGRLSKRTQLGGFQDEKDASLTNIVLVGEGVYLAGTAAGGSDTNDGTSPNRAVATFEKAKEILEQQVSAKWEAEKNLPPDDQEGFSPYIYICGNVPITGSEAWALDYEALLFTETNKAFERAEKALNPDIDPETLKPQVRRFASFLNAPMITANNGAALTMNKIIVDGMCAAVNTGIQGSLSPVILCGESAVVTLTGEAQIRNNYNTGVRLEGVLVLEGKDGQSNRQLRNIEGQAVYLAGDRAKLEMKGYSRIVSDAQNENLNQDRYGIYTGGGVSGQIFMKDYSSIEGSSSKKFQYGIFIDSNGGDIDVHMNHDASGAENAGSAQIAYTSEAAIYARNKTRIYMGGQSRIHSGSRGILAASNRSGTEGFSLEMSGDSAITRNSNYGIDLQSLGPSTIRMKDRAKITRNSRAIYEQNNSNCADRLEIILEDDARISANVYSGIELRGDAWDMAASYQRITLKDRAVIGGSGAYVTDQNVDDCGNGSAGIETEGPTSVVLQDSASVLNNKGYGIYFRRESISYRPNGTGEVELSGNSTVAGNTNCGVYSQDQSGSNLENALKIVVKDSASVRDNGNRQIDINKASELYLQDRANIYGQSGAERIHALGKIYMHGTVTVDGRIYLAGSFPITLQSPVSAGNEYHLYLAEGFIGKEVVIPDTATLDNAALYLANYIKDGAAGLAQEKSLVADRPNIILEGENNVYLSGKGNDGNDGNSPATAVRTFHRARELLRTGRFTKGANIYICDEVGLTNWSDGSGRGFDGDWSFDSDGTITNEKTGDRWTPLVKRYESYAGGLIRVPDKQTLTMKHIIVDGNKEKTKGEQLIHVGQGSEVNLRGGAVLQNNSVGTMSWGAAVLISGGTANLEGGIIQGMEVYGYKETTGKMASASAVFCENKGENWPSAFHFKSGQIRNNMVEWDEPSNGAAVVVNENTSFVMTGGLISGNVNRVTNPNSAQQERVRGAGVYVSSGKAEIRGGTIRDNTSNVGSAIYYTEAVTTRSDSRGLIISGGQISGNRVNEVIGKAPNGEYSPVYIGGPNFYLEGGGSDISDVMYLNDIRNHIIVSGDIYQSNRNYVVSLNQGSGDSQFHKGSVVVAPDGNKKADVTGYLPYFTVGSNPYVLDRGQIAREIATGGNIKESESLLLMQAVYLDGERGSDDADGSTPKTAVKTFTQAKNIGERGVGETAKDYYIIYVCGKTTNTVQEPRWSMAAPAYMCRYTGFPVYQKNGEPVEEINRAYYGNLVEPQSDLIIGAMTVYGRRSIDAKEYNGDSLFKIPANVTVTVEKEGGREAIFGRNNNTGQYIGEDGLSANLSSRGGAFQVEPEGTLKMEAGRIVETEATFGSAVYLGADAKEGTKTGHLILSESPAISGAVYLDGTGSISAAYVEPQTDYRPSGKLLIALRNDYNGRECVRYPAGTMPGLEEMEYYSFEDSINALYDIVYRTGAANVIELNQKTVLYLDGENGNDQNNGSTPESALRTLKGLYQYIADSQKTGSITSKGVAVYIVGTVTLDQNSAQKIVLNNVQTRDVAAGKKDYKGYYQDASTSKIEVDGQVYFKRYSQPKAYSAADSYFDGYGKATMKDELFFVTDGAELTIRGIYLDGHSQESASTNRLFEADGVQAMAPLVAVSDGGILNCEFAAADANSIATSTLLLNNVNNNKKTNQVGTLNGTEIYEGSGAGIEVRDGGRCSLNHTEFRNLYLGDDVIAGGTDVYHNGEELNFYNQTLFTGTVFLEGQGVAGKEDTFQTSRFLSVKEYGTPAQNDFQVLMRDPYNHRVVVNYLPKGSGPVNSQIGAYRLEERVKEFFCLSKRENEPWILELLTPSAVYIDGVNGSDDQDNAKAGSNPAHPIRTLKRAYELLYTRAGSTIMVVNTIQVEQNTSITGNQYIGVDGTVNLGSTDKVKFVRYIQPDFARDNSETDATIEAMGYNVDDFTGPLINVQGGNKLSVGSNVYFDGHSEPKTHVDLPREVIVSRESSSMAPLMTVEENAVVELQRGSVLHDNNNGYDAGQAAQGIEGGAINNRGTVTVADAVFENNHAKKGDAAYQAGTFTIQSGVANLAGHSFYLASDNSGTDAAPSWEDHVLQIGEQMPEGQVFDMDMDHAEAGRDVIVYTSAEGYQPASGADAEHDHFRLGSTVPDNLFLVESENDPAVLELQDWKILHVEVPANIYLAMTRKGSIESSTKLNAVRNGTADLFHTPEYQIVNNGRYEVKVSVNGIENVSTAAGISDDAMELKADPGDVVGEKDLYLAVKGLDTDRNDGFTAAETGLAEGSSTAFELGRLQPGSTGTFGFTGSVGVGFVDKYKDLSFPLTDTAEDVQKYMDGSGPDGLVHAKAKYLLKYKVEITPPRRQGP